MSAARCDRVTIDDGQVGARQRSLARGKLGTLGTLGVLIALVTLGAIAGCGDGSDSGDDAQGASPPSKAERVLTAEAAVYHQLCECPEALGQPDPDQCFTHFVGRNQTQEACVRDLFEANAEAIDG